MDVKLHVDSKPVELNELVVKIFRGTIAGAVAYLREIKEDWNEIPIEVTRSG